jgi:exonuclease VII small subunit
MSARGNGGRYEYYACTGRQKYGPKACRNDRLPRAKLEQAVLAQLASAYRDGDLIAQAVARAQAEAERNRPEIEQRLGSIRAEITRAERALERYYEAFEQGKLSPERCEQRLSRLQARLDDLHAQQAGLSASTRHEPTRAPTAAELAAVADELDRVIAEAEPQKAKALLRLLIEELRVNGRREILPTYHVVTPAVCAMSEKVEAAGIEPALSSRRLVAAHGPDGLGGYVDRDRPRRLPHRVRYEAVARQSGLDLGRRGPRAAADAAQQVRRGGEGESDVCADLHRAASVGVGRASSVGDAESRSTRVLAATAPAFQPGARPPAGGWIDSTVRPLAPRSQDVTELQHHISPASSWSRPQTGVGTAGTRSRMRWASRSLRVSRRGLSTA